MITHYQSIVPAFTLTYHEGVLISITNIHEDRVSFDGMKHHIELFESDINIDLYRKITLTTEKIMVIKKS